MNKTELASLARTMMDQHGLHRWKFAWCNDKTTAGWCFYSQKTIKFSTHFLEMGDFHIKQTILHEIAHALVGSGHGHDAVWKAKGREIGYVGERCLPQEIKHPDGKYLGVCVNGHEVHRHRKTSAMLGEWYHCLRCPKDMSSYDKRFVFYVTSQYRSLGKFATPISTSARRPPQDIVIANTPSLSDIDKLQAKMRLQPASETTFPVLRFTPKLEVAAEKPTATVSRAADYDQGSAFINWD